MNPQSKTCTKCGETKPLDGFHKDRTMKDGRVSKCKECVKESKARYHAANRDQIIEKKARYRAENPGKVKESQARYRAENREKLSDYQSSYRAENREKILDRDARYYAENRETLNAQSMKAFAERQQLSKAFATVPLRTPWSASEDKFILEGNGMTTYQKAIELGRTYRSSEGRLQRLRRRVLRA